MRFFLAIILCLALCRTGHTAECQGQCKKPLVSKVFGSDIHVVTKAKHVAEKSIVVARKVCHSAKCAVGKTCHFFLQNRALNARKNTRCHCRKRIMRRVRCR